MQMKSDSLLILVVLFLTVFAGGFVASMKEAFNPGPYVLALRESCENGDVHSCRILCKDMNQVDVCRKLCASGQQDMCRHAEKYNIPRNYNQEARWRKEQMEERMRIAHNM
ncbi:hypothetical protein TetV_457 [Tetraselmis virus 1]|uniref:Uncharacterized protein n=1 Tax=Tetraselmis virus 1 TaxID=2060617 RepID=A0A2P0VP40_9VIRU|nr:hypothetical protein QJ968_gp597 [Tetraselmis virus 1]AUF82539.1 hypothetical protein TetV_457 [Tetraselmis virus 1]